MDDQLSVGERAAGFHACLAEALLDQATRLRDTLGTFSVGLSGGVFQNRVLTERVMALLNEHGFDVRLGASIPCNDAGISYGQIIEVAYRAQPGTH